MGSIVFLDDVFVFTVVELPSIAIRQKGRGLCVKSRLIRSRHDFKSRRILTPFDVELMSPSEKCKLHQKYYLQGSVFKKWVAWRRKLNQLTPSVSVRHERGRFRPVGVAAGRSPPLVDDPNFSAWTFSDHCQVSEVAIIREGTFFLKIKPNNNDLNRNLGVSPMNSPRAKLIAKIEVDIFSAAYYNCIVSVQNFKVYEVSLQNGAHFWVSIQIAL